VGSVSCYGQLMGAPEAPTFVVNMILAGPRTGIGRIQHLLGAVGEPYDDPALAEFRTDVNSNLNLRPQVVRAIDYPLGGDTVGPDLRMADLRVGYDHESGLLRLRAPDGSVVRPVHLGLSTLAYLPSAQSFMIRVFGVHPAVLVGGWALRDRLSIPPAAGPVHRPRLTVGTVVVARASWRMPISVFPKPDKSETDGAYLIRLARWLREHGVPRRFFARIIDARGGRYGANGKGYKPVYVDVTNWFLLQDFVRSLSGDRLLVLEEVLPDLFDAPHYGEAGAHVTEYIFDVNGRRS
jgi:Lantibiotic dehydratase, N terminus